MQSLSFIAPSSVPTNSSLASSSAPTNSSFASSVPQITVSDVINCATILREHDPSKWTAVQQHEAGAIATIFKNYPHRGVDALDSMLSSVQSNTMQSANAISTQDIYAYFDMFVCGLLTAAYMAHVIGYTMLVFFFTSTENRTNLLRSKGSHFEATHFGYCPWNRPKVWETYDKLLHYPRMIQKLSASCTTRTRYNISNRMYLLRRCVTTANNNYTSSSVRMCVNCSAKTNGWPISWTEDRILALNWCKNCYLPNLISGEQTRSYQISKEVLEKCDAIYTHTRHTENTKMYLFPQVVAKKHEHISVTPDNQALVSIADSNNCATLKLEPTTRSPKRTFYQMQLHSIANPNPVNTIEETPVVQMAQKRRAVHFDDTPVINDN